MISSYPGCFVCGADNEAGMRVQFTSDGGEARARYTFARTHQGYEGMVHGGLLCSLLDEVMVKAVQLAGVSAVTGWLEVRFRRAVPVGEDVLAKGRLVMRRGPLVCTEGELVLPDGTVAAQARAKFMAAPPQAGRPGRESERDVS